MKDAEEEIQKLVRQDIIEPSTSPWNSNIVLVKKSDGTWRFCVDFRAVNECVLKNSHPLPRIDDTLDALSGARYFSNVDLKAGYFQIPVAEKDRPKTAFSFPGGGLWQFKRMPMGMSNSAPVFERLMEKVLSGLTWKICLVYLDDIIIFSKSFESHIENLQEVFLRLREANLKLSPKKCHFFQKKVKFLGHVVSEEGVATDPAKIQAVKDWPVPKTVKEVRSYLGLTSYYRKFIYQYADKAKCLYKVTEKNQKFCWTEDCQKAFEELKTALITAPILSYPTADDLFIIDCDASNVGMGAVLSQIQDGVETVICYFSKTFSRAERRYCVTRRELLAVIASIKNFHHYLYGRHFKVRSDHGALRWLFNFKNPEGQLARWFEVLASYDFKIEHRAGRSHGNADALSRRPCFEKECPHCIRAEKNLEICTHDGEEINREIAVDQLVRSENVSKQSEETCHIANREFHIREFGSKQENDRKEQDPRANLGEFQPESSLKEISKDPEGYLDELPPKSDLVRVCTRRRDYSQTDSKMDADGRNVPEMNMCPEKLPEFQKSDDVLKIVIGWKESGKPKWEEISDLSPELKFFWSRLESFIVKNEILYRKWESNNGKQYELYAVIPERLKRLVLKQVHNTVTGGHLGFRENPIEN